MKNLAVAVALLAFAACASKPPKPKYMEDKSQPKYATGHQFSESPEDVVRAARAVLDRLTNDSTPQASDPVETHDGRVTTGWVYLPASKDKYVRYDYNGTPRRKALAARRVYEIDVSPSLAGSQVAMNIKEEIQEVDLKTGEPKGWKKVDAERAAYDMLLTKLQEQIRAQ